MIDRYSRPNMARLWGDEHKYDTWLKVELAVCEAWAAEGVIPESDMELIRDRAWVNHYRVKKIEQEVGHDVIAFTQAVGEALGEERRWIHYGLTSSDVVDTATGYILKQANLIIKNGINELIGTLMKLAKEHKHTVMMGRTHGIHAEPTTFGLKMALWYEEMERNYHRFRRVAAEVECGKISGAVGTYSNIPPQIEEHACQTLGIKAAEIASQVISRDVHADYIATIALIATSLDKFATEIRNLQRTEIREVEEPFRDGQKGSSAMPHKRNPIGCENISGLARVLRGYVIPAYEDVVLWGERDISHSSVERIILPSATTLIDYMLHRFNSIMEGLAVNEKKMRLNIAKSHGLPSSGHMLTKLVEKGLSREDAYAMVQKEAMAAWHSSTPLSTFVNKGPIADILSEDEISECFGIDKHLKYVDAIYNRLGLG